MPRWRLDVGIVGGSALTLLIQVPLLVSAVSNRGLTAASLAEAIPIVGPVTEAVGMLQGPPSILGSGLNSVGAAMLFVAAGLQVGAAVPIIWAAARYPSVQAQNRRARAAAWSVMPDVRGSYAGATLTLAGF